MATKTMAMSAAGTICCEHGSCFDSWHGGGAAFSAPHAATHQALARESHSDSRIRVTIYAFFLNSTSGNIRFTASKAKLTTAPIMKTTLMPCISESFTASISLASTSSPPG